MSRSLTWCKTTLLKLPDNTKIQVPIWHSGMPGAFFIHVHEALSTYKCKGYFSKYQEALDAILKSKEIIDLLKQTIVQMSPATLLAGMPKRTKKKKKTKEVTSQVGVMEEPKGTWTSLQADQSQLTTLELGLNHAHLAKKSLEPINAIAAGHFFSLYTNLLSKDNQFQWDKIVSSQVDTPPWTDVRGKEQSYQVLHVLNRLCDAAHADGVC